VHDRCDVLRQKAVKIDLRLDGHSNRFVRHDTPLTPWS
jgi:hypothetical protein